MFIQPEKLSISIINFIDLNELFLPCCAMEVDEFKEKSKNSFKRIFDDSNSNEEEFEDLSHVSKYLLKIN
jgi:hypothetical protein